MQQKKENIFSFIMLTLGSVIAAFALEEFLVPNNIFDGGVTGISMILVHIINVKLSILVAIINIPFLLYALRRMGHAFLFKAAYSMILFSIMLGVFEPLKNATSDLLLATAFGGIFLGVGVGMVLRGGACLDGSEIVGIIINKKTSISIGRIVLIINIAIYAIAGLKFGIDRAMYSMLMYFITSKVIDIVEIGWDQAKSVMIITDDGEKMAKNIYENLGRTVTFMRGEGLISGQEKDILYCVVTRAEIYDLRHLINNSDTGAFTTISDVSEIIGNHIKKSSSTDEL